MDEALMCVESFSSPQSDTYTLALAAYAHSLADVSSDARARVIELMNSKAVVQGGCTTCSLGQGHLAMTDALRNVTYMWDWLGLLLFEDDSLSLLRLYSVCSCILFVSGLGLIHEHVHIYSTCSYM